MAERLHSRSRARALMRSAVLVMLACMIALSTLVSACTLAALHDHECAGENCPTCLVLDMAQGMLSSAATSNPTVAASWLSLAIGALAVVVCMLALPAKTPVSDRVKLLI